MSLRETKLQQEVTHLKGKMTAVKRELADERKAHARTVDHLERARNAKIAKPRPKARRRKLKGDVVEVICGDVHGNKQDAAAVSAFLGDLKCIQPDRMMLGGDIIDCGGFLAEHHTLGYVAETLDSYEDDCAAGNKFLDAVQHHANEPEIEYIEGNHEWRVERWAVTQVLKHQKDIELLRRTFCAQTVLRLDERGINYYRQGEIHEGCSVPGWIKRGNLHFVHKLSNARNAASVALAQTGGSVVYFDTHRADYFPDYLPGTGLIAAWNPGCLCKRQKLYMNTRPSRWTHGYLLRFIAPSGNFQMVMVSINDGVSYATDLLTRKKV